MCYIYTIIVVRKKKCESDKQNSSCDVLSLSLILYYSCLALTSFFLSLRKHKQTWNTVQILYYLLSSVSLCFHPRLFFNKEIYTIILL